jgi:hypothetical protein
VPAKYERLTAHGGFRGFVGTLSEAIQLIGQYQDAGVQLVIKQRLQKPQARRAKDWLRPTSWGGSKSIADLRYQLRPTIEDG